ncbi:hypothetical protein [Xylocopilactobacillus apicola]|uniref:Uncharacterized protein n=1 Tax=Xylocopilactobacillus apicola TaxID=2932184 RepID=A0AAU9D5D4_9LACO|nr:hypothetical protein [Xylocopilactobacillus apicola]BDR57686.1 hypothetical protein XA3_01270 [Xylocopilactobacillus apicola]
MLDLVINPDSVRVSHSKISTQIYSDIYFQIGETFFPEEKWDDFSVIVLGWWLKEALSISSDSRSVFRFMDGPYYFEAHLIDGKCSIDFISERHNKKEIVSNSVIEHREFLRLLTSNARLLIRKLPFEANEFKEVLELKNNLKQLQQHAKLITPS